MYSLTIEPIGQTIPIAPGQTVLDACLRNGVWLPHACCHGLCATCKVQVVDGEVEQGEASTFALMDFERDNGQCLACCATAQWPRLWNQTGCLALRKRQYLLAQQLRHVAGAAVHMQLRCHLPDLAVAVLR